MGKNLKGKQLGKGICQLHKWRRNGVKATFETPKTLIIKGEMK